MTDPIYEGILLKCAEYNIGSEHVPAIYRLCLEKNATLKKVYEMLQNGAL